MTEDSRSPTLEELLRMAMRYELQDVNVSLPGKIEEYDPETQKAVVKPLVQRLESAEDGSDILEPYPPIPGVPVVFPRGGGFFISMPVAVGDFCLLIFCSRSIDKYKAGTGLDTSPEDFRLHDASDAVALMGLSPFSKAIKQADADNMVIGLDNGVQIHIKPDGEIHLGNGDAQDALALASKVEAGLQDIVDAIIAGVPGSMDGGTALQSSIVAGLDNPVGGVGSAVVKAD